MKVNNKELEKASSAMMKVVYEKKLKEAIDTLTTVVTEMVNKYIPSEIMKCAEKYPQFFSSSNYASFCKSDGSKAMFLGGKTAVPVRTVIPINDTDYDVLANADKIVEQIRGEMSRYSYDTYNALKALRTTTKIKEHFPEALKYINVEVTESNIPLCSILRNIFLNATKEEKINEADKQ